MGAIVGEVKSLKMRLLGVRVFCERGGDILGVSENSGKARVFNDGEGAMKIGNGCTATRPSVSSRVPIT